MRQRRRWNCQQVSINKCAEKQEELQNFVMSANLEPIIAALRENPDDYVATQSLGITPLSLGKRKWGTNALERAIGMSYLGYPNTIGLPAIEYLIADDVVCSEGCEHLYTDNHTPKLNPFTIQLWSNVLNAVKDSKLRLQSRSFSDPDTAESYLNQFENHEIDRKRIELVGPTSRMSASNLTRLKMTKLIADDEEGYIKIAKAITKDIEKLNKKRLKRREQMQNSTLCNSEAFARDYESLLRKAWQDWCKSQH